MPGLDGWCGLICIVHEAVNRTNSHLPLTSPQYAIATLSYIKKKKFCVNCSEVLCFIMQLLQVKLEPTYANMMSSPSSIYNIEILKIRYSHPSLKSNNRFLLHSLNFSVIQDFFQNDLTQKRQRYFKVHFTT